MLFERAGSEDQLALNLPFLVNNVVTAANNNSTANNIRLQTGFNLSLNPSSVNVTTVRLRAVNPESVNPSIDQWNFGIQRLLPGNMVLTLDYVGTKGTHLSTLRNLNQQSFNANGIGTGVIPFPTLGPIEYRDSGGNSNYHGGEITLEKRFSRGLSFRSSTPTRNLLTRHRSTLPPAARAVLHRTHTIFASDVAQATSTYVINLRAATSTSCLSDRVVVILRTARSLTS